jgi:hypothetical protein
VAARRADLDAVEAEDAGAVGRRVGDPRPVAVVGEDDEPQPGARGGGRDLVGGPAAVGAGGVDVDDAGDRSVGMRRQRQARRRERHAGPDDNGGHQGRRRQENLPHDVSGSSLG